jgi:methylase of polypeptide subunit release factors
MTRLPRQLLARAWKENRLLPLLLKACRDLHSARRELEWLKNHAVKTARKVSHEEQRSWRLLLNKLCYERARGKPLQYLLGSEFFGELEITCRPGVLIPR